MGKGLKIFLGIIGILIVFVGIGGFLFYSNFYVLGPLAVLSIDEGSAQYKLDGDWKNAKSGMELEEGHSVKTLESSKAKIIFSDSVMRLDANTEISLDKLNTETVSLSQKVGKTWSRLLKISGISSYEIKTPDAIATVRGTGFSIEVKEGESTEVKVADGEVEVKTNKDKTSVEENKQIIVKKDDEGLEGKKKNLEKDEWINENLAEDEKHIKEVKARLKAKYGKLFEKMAEQQGLSAEDQGKLFDDWMDGEYSVKEAIADGTIPAEIAKIIPPELRRY